ncbi:MAG: PilZ domain-containing protein [Candidatus Omnitrophica bacterium]|nr:PilZ domain-containing protein [Candidatus Omnitrophota bacterium]MBU1869584.1 PilZ domain-containing protein [Candidatus Omnitrophota bacterium]
MQIQRRFNRWQVDYKTRVRLNEASDFVECAINDISYMGARICVPVKLPRDTFIELHFELSAEFVLDVEAWVVWQRAVDGHNIYGLYFTRVKDTDKEKIYQFVRKHAPQEIGTKWWSLPDHNEKKGGESMEDRRIFARFNVHLPLKFLSQSWNKEGSATTHDLSAKGISIITSEEIAPRTTLEMWLEIPDKGDPLYTRGEVVWSKMVEPNKYFAGVNLEKADLMGLSRVLRSVKA